ncbi:hypothetical protein MAP00_008243 [Monascus purpureus]|nr:hypothetical protein MAP00_008243 [Monascus purpureus]
MDAEDLFPLIERLDDNVDDLEEIFKPFLDLPLTATASKLPVLDKAKLHVLTTYALESLIFSYLRLQGVNAKEHPVFRELTRVRQYFEKIKALETEPEKRSLMLDKAAAGRFIKHGLAGNDKIDLERAEQEAKEKAVAQLRAAMLAKRGAGSETQSTGPEDHDRGSSSDAKSGASSDNDNVSSDGRNISTGLQKDMQMQKPTKTKSEKQGEDPKISRREIIYGKQRRKEVRKERRERKKETRKARKGNERSHGES